jgi:hypothetical protein
MNLRRALFIAAVMLPIAAAPAMAQVQPNPFDQPAVPFGQPTANPFDRQPQQDPPCLKDFGKLRDDTEKNGAAVMAAQKAKVPLPEACRLLTVFNASQERLLAYAKKNQVSCGIPSEIIQRLSLGQTNVAKARTNVCKMAAQPQRQQGPSLSDALGAPVPDSSNIKTGRGTFDTLTGTPLGNTAK